jgi:hypothetical protein
MPKFTWLRGLGPLGTLAANILAFLTANWGVAVSAILAIYVGFSQWATGVIHSPETQAAAATFLVLLWSYVGITILIDRHHPRDVRSVPDYRYGLTFEGINPNIDFLSDDAWLNFGVQVRNFSQAPIRYHIESFDVRIGTRALPKSEKQFTGYLPRGSGKTISPAAFKKEDVREYFGKRVTGTAEFAITYGHPERKPERRLRIGTKITLHIQEKPGQEELFPGFGPPMAVAFGADIVKEDDESIDDTT